LIGVNKEQLYQAEKLAVLWCDKHIEDVIPRLTPSIILQFSQQSFKKIEDYGYDSLKICSAYIAFLSRTGLKNTQASKRKHAAEMEKFQTAANNDLKLYRTRSQIKDSLESKFFNKIPIINRLFELSIVDVMDAIRDMLQKSNRLNLYTLHYKFIEAWVRSIVRFPGDPNAIVVLEQLMPNIIVYSKNDECSILSKTLVLSSYILSLMADPKFKGKLSYARYSINTGNSSSINKIESPVYAQCANFLGLDKFYQNMAIKFLEIAIATNEVRDGQFYQLDLEGDSRALLGMIENGLITIFGLSMSPSSRILYFGRKLAFKMKDIAPIGNNQLAVQQSNFLTAFAILKDLDIGISQDILLIN